ncbi:Serine/threonine-protein kinase 40 [Halotydeus destructor]|nr:Serine/threonine-protein kinase 40 [Halotydeus destructor]
MKRSYSLSRPALRRKDESKRKRTVSASAVGFSHGLFHQDEPSIVPEVPLETLVETVHLSSSENDVKAGTLVDLRRARHAGQYVLGNVMGSSPVKSIVQVLSRLKNDVQDKYYVIKILTLPEDNQTESQDDRQGRMLIHTEFSLLSLLTDMEGVIRLRELFKDDAWEEVIAGNVSQDQAVPDRTEETEKNLVYSGKKKKRICLVLDCVFPHDYSNQSQDWINLQHYVIKEKRLSEKEAIRIFYCIIRVVSELHKRNVVHRDLKLGNMAYNRRLKKICIINFCLGKQLTNDDDLLRDQRGSPAYISPDVLSGKPYKGKPSDMWALGVVLYTMLYGQFPFYDSVPSSLFAKIKTADFSLPKDIKISESSQNLIKKLLNTNADLRLSADEVFNMLQSSITTYLARTKFVSLLQVVPDSGKPETMTYDRKSPHKTKSSKTRAAANRIDQQDVPSTSRIFNFSHLDNMAVVPDNSNILSYPIAGLRQPVSSYGRVVMSNGRPSLLRESTRTTPLGTLPIQRIGEDARPVDAEELSQLRQRISVQRSS